MSSIKIKSVTINHSNYLIRVTRSILFEPNNGEYVYYIPDEINNNEAIDVEDPICNGSTLLYPRKPSFPADLERFKNQRFKIQTVDGCQIIGKLIGTHESSKTSTQNVVTLDVETFHSPKNSLTVPKGLISLNQSQVLTYFLLEESSPSSSTGFQAGNANRYTKIVINNTNIAREILVSYCVIGNSDSLGYFVHSVKGIQSKPLYTKPNLESNIPIKITTEYIWKPIWDITIDRESNLVGDCNHNNHNHNHNHNNNNNNYNNNNTTDDGSFYGGTGVTFNIITKDEKYVYTVENFVCYKNYENKIQLNSFETTCNRAVFVHLTGPIQIALYFENNSKSLLSKSTIKFVDDYTELPSLDLTKPTTLQQNIRDFAVNNNNNNNDNNNTKKPVGLFFSNDKKTEFQFLNPVEPKSIGIIVFKVPNESIKVYKDIAHQPLWGTKSKEYRINEIKLSLIFTLMDAQVLSKIKYQFVNATQFKTKYIVDCNSITNNKTNNNNAFGGGGATDGDDSGIPRHEDVSIDTSNCEKIGETLYLFDSLPLSINQFEMTYKNKKQLMTHARLPQVVLTYLKEKGIDVSYSPNKFDTYDLSSLDSITQDTLIKLMGTLSLEEKTSNYFNKAFSTSPIAGILFDAYDFNQTASKSSFNNNPSFGLFGSQPPQQQQQQQQQQQHQQMGGLFGNVHQGTSLFGSQPPQQQGSLFGSVPPQAHSFVTSGGLFGSTIPQTSTSGFGGFGAKPAAAAAAPLLQPTSTSSFGGTSFNKIETPTGTPTPTSFSFGASTTPSSSSVFGGFSGAPVSATPSFGTIPSSPVANTTTTTTTATAITATPPSTSNPEPSLFESTPTNITSLFGGSSTPQPSTFSFSTPQQSIENKSDTNYTPTPKPGDITFASISAMPQFSNKSVEEIKHEQTKKFKLIRDNQGFCCSCSMSDYIGADQNSRANLGCSLLGSQSSSAHFYNQNPITQDIVLSNSIPMGMDSFSQAIIRIVNYTLSIVNCSGDINPIDSKHVTIKSKEIYSFEFQIFTTSKLDSSYQCFGDLYNEVSQVIHSIIININTSETMIDNGHQSGENSIDDDSLNFGSQFTCDDACPNLNHHQEKTNHKKDDFDSDSSDVGSESDESGKEMKNKIKKNKNKIKNNSSIKMKGLTN
ncbi:hypothetical protein ACTFIZ_001521 [Dictyostelium cf. discoideum]